MRILAAALALAALSGMAVAQTEAAAPAKPVSGKQLYENHCALCHGVDAKGGGPYAPQLKTWPPDLTTLAKKNGGVFPALRVAETIDGSFDKSSHGSREMPIWGPVFRSLATGHADNAALRIKSLVKHLESVQEK